MVIKLALVRISSTKDLRKCDSVQLKLLITGFHNSYIHGPTGHPPPFEFYLKNYLRFYAQKRRVKRHG